MYRDNSQCNRAIQVLLASMPGLKVQKLWTNDGPTELAFQYIEQDGGPLSSGERALLLAAWELADRRGSSVTFRDVLWIVGAPLEALATLMSAIDHGAAAVDKWIAKHTTKGE